MNSTVITIFAIIVVIIVVLLLVIISMLSKSKTEAKDTVRKINDTVSMPNVMRPSFPSSIENLSKKQVLDITKKVFDSYKIFDYKNMDIHELDKKEWHSWQISFLLMLYKKEEEFFIPAQDKIFHNFLLNSSENDIKSLMRGIIKKYENYVNPNHTKDMLSKEYIWSNKDVSIMFYFLANYKKYKK